MNDVTTSGCATPDTAGHMGWKTWLAWSLLSAFAGVIARAVFYLTVLWLPYVGHPVELLSVALVAIFLSFLALPHFLVSLVQALVIRRHVSHAWLWLLPSLLGYVLLMPYLDVYGHLSFSTDGDALRIGTDDFWSATRTSFVFSVIYGALVGWAQLTLVIRRYSAHQVKSWWWILTTALAFGIGFPFGDQVMLSLAFHPEHLHTVGPLILAAPLLLLVDIMALAGPWGVIGMITGAALVWLKPR
jgi:hypothetical protein